MANTGFFHHIGTFLLFAGAILLLITTISAPVINDISLLKVTLSNHSTVTFGTFGYCVLDVPKHNDGHDYCTSKHIGYNLALLIENTDSTDFNTASTDTSKALTRVMILHPIICGLAFIAFLLALGSGICGSLLAALLSAITWVLSVVVLATDFVLFGIIKGHVNGKKDASFSHAKFGVGIWTLVAGMVVLFFGTFVVLFSCCSARRHRNDVNTKAEYAAPAGGRRKFWQRRTQY